MSDKPEWLNWQQACKLLGCSQSHFYNLVNSGELPSLRSGKVRGVRVKRFDCVEYTQKWRQRLEESEACGGENEGDE